MSISKPIPLFPPLSQLDSVSLSDYPQVDKFLQSGPDWWLQHWQWALGFLKYIARAKSEHTFGRFRNETERFLIWAFLVKKKPIDDYRKADILDYADFCWKPPGSWIGLESHDRFVSIDGYFEVNTYWLPFRIRTTKKTDEKPDKRRYKPSQETLGSMFTALSAFYTHLMNEEICFGNVVGIARKDCRHMIKDTQVKEVRRLSQDQWSYVMETAENLADKDPKYERSLFAIVSLKTLFLRISELSERKDWSPEMQHFWQDHDGNWWLKVYGKGRKIRDITVPNEYCLLYTSPSPRDLSTSRMPSSA